jgi:uncharacterized protein
MAFQFPIQARSLKRSSSPTAVPSGADPVITTREIHTFWSCVLSVIAALASLLASNVSGAESVIPAARPFVLKQVRLLEGPFREAMSRNQAYLLSLDPDRLLHTFRINAGLPASAQPYGGWEAPAIEVRGHSLGHYLSALSLLYASTGDNTCKARADYLVAELAKCQDALAQKGAHPGFLSAFPESFIDRVEAGQPVWAPYYTLHKIMAGLLDAYVHCGNQQALEVLKRQAAWVKFRMDRLSPEQRQVTLRNEFGGMNDVLANLYGITGQPEHLELARAFDHQVVLDPLARHEDKLDGLHANTQIPKFIGAARQYELTGEPRYRALAQFSWERVALHRSYVIGGHSDREHFFPVDQFAQHLSAETTETCNTYNMLKLTRHLFGWAPSATAMDFYERALYNHILASQDPKDGMFVYLMSLKPGHFKTYSLPHDSFWCCVGTGMENHCKYGDTIYFHDDESLYVNLFIASELDWAERGLSVRMDTKFPEEDTVRLSLKCKEPIEGNLKIRWPAWVQSGFAVTVNGEPQNVEGNPGSYVTLRRMWRDGDRLEVRLPMSLRFEPLPGSIDIVALLYGPIVLAGELGREGLEKVSPYAKAQLDHVRVPTLRVPVFVTKEKDWIQRVKAVPGQPLAFRTEGLAQPNDITLAPFYRVHHQRYSVYWDLFTEAGWEAYQTELAVAEEHAREAARRIIDFVKIGDGTSETRHALKGERMQAGSHAGRGWRHADNGGWFSYEIAVNPDTKALLQATFWGDDAGPRTFDVLVDGQKLATLTLDRNAPGKFFEVQWPLTNALTAGKTKVTVRFQARPDSIAGGLFGLQVTQGS